MLGNIVDHRTERLSPHADAVLEPSVRDDWRRRGEPFFDWSRQTAVAPTSQ